MGVVTRTVVVGRRAVAAGEGHVLHGPGRHKTRDLGARTGGVDLYHHVINEAGNLLTVLKSRSSGPSGTSRPQYPALLVPQREPRATGG